jgi:hypothetical protein
MPGRSHHAGRCSLLAVALAAVTLAALTGASPASAESPWWHLDARSAPTYLPPGGEGVIEVTATNVGDAPVNASKETVRITDNLPRGLTAVDIFGTVWSNIAARELLPCSVEALSCTFTGTLLPYETLQVMIRVRVGAEVSSGGESKVTVAGGEAPEKLLSRPITVNGESTPFGVEHYEITPEIEGGVSATQAGSHPFQVTATFDLNQASIEEEFNGHQQLFGTGIALTRNLHFKLPPGLIGNPNAVPQCSDAGFSALAANDTNECPSNTVIGVATVTLHIPNTFFPVSERDSVPLFNLEPAPGEPARFAFEVLHVPVVLDTAVRTGGDYGVEVSVHNSSEAADVLSSQVTFWGEPGDQRHDQSRGWECLVGGAWLHHEAPCTAPEPRSVTPFLTVPTSCLVRPLETTVEGDSWPTSEAPQGLELAEPSEPSLIEGFEGCNALPFSPSIEVAPTTRAASTPTGLNINVEVPQTSTLKEKGLAEADVKDTTVTLPEGVQLSPSAANGLEACTEPEIGFTRVNPQTHTDEFTPDPPSCPDASKVGSVRIETPFLQKEGEAEGKTIYEPLEGAVYLAAQNENPFGSLVALYLVAQAPRSHVLVKLAGEVTLNERTGQVTTTFKNTPQLPFGDLRLHFSEGPRASVTTPPLCHESYTTNASFTAWSGATSALESSFPITSGPEGAACSNPQPFAPGFAAGTTSDQAGAFTPFTLNIARPDADQALKSISMHLPSGLAAMISSVTPCAEPQAAKGMCGPESLIGHTTTSSGLGEDPFNLGGKVFLTGPYRGAPFGLSIVTPAVAGPFNFGDVVVRSTINVDPHTAAVTITSELPTMVETATAGRTGIPVQLKQTNVTVDRPGFEFNPTNCTPMKVEGTLTGSEGTSDAVSSRFQVGGCDKLPFKPKLTALTEGRTSKANGASLHVKVTSSLGQANIAKTVLIFPKVLPTRLTTIQKACVAAVFNANPAACPEGSVIGAATIHTPILNSPLSGPGYLVSHGGAAFPDAEFVLQGEGITLILDGQTNIRNGITSSTFNALPDAPFTTFDAVLPEGPHSAFAANGNLCATMRVVTVRKRVTRRVHGRLVRVLRAIKQVLPPSLSMPTTISGQNGAVVKQTTKIAVSGCPKAKKAKNGRKASAKHRKGRKK